MISFENMVFSSQWYFSMSMNFNLKLWRNYLSKTVFMIIIFKHWCAVSINKIYCSCSYDMKTYISDRKRNYAAIYDINGHSNIKCKYKVTTWFLLKIWYSRLSDTSQCRWTLIWNFEETILTYKCLRHKWPLIFSVYRNHNPVLSLFMTFQQCKRH
jgi:hypothetical protein